MRRLRQIRRRAGGELRIVFDRRHPPRSADQLGENCRVIADAGADMQDMLPWRGAAANQRRMKRGLAVVQATLRQDADHVVGVQVIGSASGVAR
jgi:hypothetical protein